MSQIRRQQARGVKGGESRPVEPQGSRVDRWLMGILPPHFTTWDTEPEDMIGYELTHPRRLPGGNA